MRCIQSVLTAADPHLQCLALSTPLYHLWSGVSVESRVLARVHSAAEYVVDGLTELLSNASVWVDSKAHPALRHEHEAVANIIGVGPLACVGLQIILVDPRYVHQGELRGGVLQVVKVVFNIVAENVDWFTKSIGRSTEDGHVHHDHPEGGHVHLFPFGASGGSERRHLLLRGWEVARRHPMDHFWPDVDRVVLRHVVHFGGVVDGENTKS